ncbi:MAG: Rpn family recombination-promoting nuclease/putative transposase, partial [Deltaproteobacteria bacterium]|nr:Rpn family recombination-promoting nuclease/putative transposase [Deltaproteobacteria bacterium]
FGGSLVVGQKYIELPKVAFIGIVDFNIFKSAEFQSNFTLLETKRHELMTDKLHFTFFELPKFKDAISEKDRLGLLFRLLKAQTGADLEQVKATGVPEIMEVIDVYHAVTASEEFYEIQFARDMALFKE